MMEQEYTLSKRVLNTTILCIDCEEYVKVISLQGHRRLHKALDVFGYHDMGANYTAKQLLKRRRNLVQNIMSDSKGPGDSLTQLKELEKIDKAYEILRFRVDTEESKQKEEHWDTLEELENLTWHKEESALINCGQAVGICQNQNKKWRTIMEDAYFFRDNLKSMNFIGCFGLFDGYSGAKAAESCARNFGDILKDKLCVALAEPSDKEGQIFNVENIYQDEDKRVITALKKSFKELDQALKDGQNEQSKMRWSGCSAAVVLIKGHTLFVSNAGDVRGILMKGDGTHQRVTANHSPIHNRERHRIEKSDGKVSSSTRTCLVNGLVTSTRGLGNHGDTSLKKSVISKPTVLKIDLNEKDQFIALYTKGISDIFNEDEVVLLLEDILPESAELNLLRSHYQTENEDNSIDKHATVTNAGDDVFPEQSKTQEQTFKESERHSEEKECLVGDQGKNQEVPPPLKRDTTMYKQVKANTLAMAMSRRLVNSALLAGSRENTSAMIILLKGCPINLYLLPS